jgi:hypothetical protein
MSSLHWGAHPTNSKRLPITEKALILKFSIQRLYNLTRFIKMKISMEYISQDCDRIFNALIIQCPF